MRIVRLAVAPILLCALLVGCGMPKKTLVPHPETSTIIVHLDGSYGMELVNLDTKKAYIYPLYRRGFNEGKWMVDYLPPGSYRLTRMIFLGRNMPAGTQRIRIDIPEAGRVYYCGHMLVEVTNRIIGPDTGTIMITQDDPSADAFVQTLDVDTFTTSLAYRESESDR